MVEHIVVETREAWAERNAEPSSLFMIFLKYLLTLFAIGLILVLIEDGAEEINFLWILFHLIVIGLPLACWIADIWTFIQRMKEVKEVKEIILDPFLIEIVVVIILFFVVKSIFSSSLPS